MKRVLALALMLGVMSAWGQFMPPAPRDGVSGPATVPTPVYDVVSIKENKSGPGMVSWGNDGDSYKGTNVQLGMLLADAYGIRQGLIFGLPKWAEETRFDMLAKVSDPDPAALKKLTDTQRETMLVRVLEDRFGVKVHRETRQLGLFDLVVAKDGAKLKETKPETEAETYARENAGPAKVTVDLSAPVLRGEWHFGPGVIDGSEMPVEQLVGILESQINKQVINQTGLHGKYDIHLRWAPDGREATSDLLSIFSALEEQLGLRLKADKGPVEVLVVDQVKMPAAN